MDERYSDPSGMASFASLPRLRGSVLGAGVAKGSGGD